MDKELLRAALHEYVDAADECILSAIYVLVQDKIPSAEKEKYDQGNAGYDLQTEGRSQQGISKTYTVEESMNMIRQYKK